MKLIKRLALALLLSLASEKASAGLESITNNTHAIKTHTEGKIDIPYGIGMDYVKNGVPLIGKLSRVLGGSPYRMTQLSSNDFVFSDVNNSVVSSRFFVVESKDTSDKKRNSFRSLAYISGSRDFVRKFEGCMVVDFTSNYFGKIDYGSRMFIVPRNGARAFLIRNGMCLPFIGEYIREPFENEQRGVVKMINGVATNVFGNPELTLQKIISYSNAVEGILFTPTEIKFVEDSLIREGYLRK